MGIDRNSVFLLTGAQGDKKAFGTGFAVAHQDGQLYILTCAHVVDQLDGKVKVGRYEAEAEIEALGAADGIDLALLRIPCVQPPPLLNRPIPGEPEMKFHICGYGPFSGAKDNYVLRHIKGKLGKSIAFESVRGSGRTDAWDLHVEDDDFSRLQGGYSGSPLCDQEGRLIAVVSHKIGSQGQRGHAVAITNLKSIYPEIEQLLPSFSDTGKPVRIIRKGPLYRYLPDSTVKRLSFGLLAVALLPGLIIFAKYLLHSVPKIPATNKYADTQYQRITKKNNLPEIPEAEIKTDIAPESKIVLKPVQPAESEQVSPPAHLVSKIEAQDIMTDPITGMEFVSVPGGSFLMGSPDSELGRLPDEGPVDKVRVESFWMGKYEVTQGQWKKIMGSNPSEFQNGDEYPMENVSWDEVQEFIVELNKQSKQSGREYRLPTEAEWEYAARAGTTTARYWGDDISCDRAMYNNRNSRASCMEYIRSEEAPAALTAYSTAPVGSYPPNQFGLHDMLGNVAEFCSNLYRSYLLSRRHRGTKSRRVVRGGSWNSRKSVIRSASRDQYSPKMRSNDIGFRLVLSVQKHENINGKTKGKSASSEQSSSKVSPVHSTASKPDTATATVPSGNGSQNDIVVPRPQPLTDSDETVIDTVTGMEFVSVPGGCFQMGSPDNEQGRSHNEGPRHEVCVDDFRMGKYEVTQGQWVKIMGSNPSQYQKGDKYPVEKVSWNKIREFITELNKQSGREYRLPTEAEWEYAARAGTTTARYWGEDISCDRAMYGNDKYQEEVSCMDYIRSEEALTPYSSAPVGSYPPNQFGLYDMLGNVSEFCSNWLGDYPSAQLHNPQGPAKGNIRVFRGGALGSSESGVRSAFRWGLPLHERNYGIGFRLVLPIQKSHD